MNSQHEGSGIGGVTPRIRASTLLRVRTVWLAPIALTAILMFFSGGTVPVQALPSFFRFATSFEPLRQVLGGVRAILYFNAQADAGLTRGVVPTAVGLVFWLIAGAAVTRWYDRRGMDRLQPDVLEFAQRSARAYTAGAQAPVTHRDRAWPPWR